MSMESDFIALVKTKTAITDEVGVRTYTNIVPQYANEPNLLIQRQGGEAEVFMDGADDLHRSELILQCRSRSMTDLIALRDAVISSLNGLSQTQGSTEFQCIFVEYSNSGYDENVQVYYEDLLLTVWHKVTS